MKQVLLQIIQDSTKAMPTKSKTDLSTNYWFWIATAEFALIIILVLKLRQKHQSSFKPQENKVFQSSKDSSINMNDLMDSIHKSKDLYKKLTSKCHPDRFTDLELNSKADILFQEITKNQRNYKKLLELKENAESQLKITI